MEQIPQQLQHELAQFQTIQQQAQNMASQRLQIELQLKEVERALSELEKVGENAEVYKSIGTLLIKGSKTKIQEELKEKKETLSLRVKALEKQENKIQERLKEMQAKIQEQLKSYQKAG